MLEFVSFFIQIMHKLFTTIRSVLWPKIILQLIVLFSLISVVMNSKIIFKNHSYLLPIILLVQASAVYTVHFGTKPLHDFCPNKVANFLIRQVLSLSLPV